MKEIEEKWIATGAINIEDITSKANFLGKAIDEVLEEDHTKKPTTHRFHREMARIYRGKLNDALKEESFVRADIIVQTMIDSYNPTEIMFWYDNPDFKDEKDGDYHHNDAGKDKIKMIRSCAEDLQARLGSLEEKLYARRPEETEDKFKRIIKHICKVDIEKHAIAIKDVNISSEYNNFILSVDIINTTMKRASATREGGILYLNTTLCDIEKLHKKYNERYVGKKYHDVCTTTRMAAERFLIDVELLRTVIIKYLKYKENHNSFY